MMSTQLLYRSSLSMLQAQLKRHPPLSRIEERQLALRSQEGDQQSRDLLALHNISFVISVARKFDRRGAGLDELVQAGVLGLLYGIRHFDAGRGTRLSTYSAWWIRAYIQKHLREMVACVKAETPTPGQSRKPLPRTISLNEPLGLDDDSETMQDRLESEDPGPESWVSRDQRSRHVRTGLSRLRRRMGHVGWDIVHHRLMNDEPLTLAEVGQRHGISRERVRQVESRLVVLLERYFKETMKIEPRSSWSGAL